jgi:hypothetical protein
MRQPAFPLHGMVVLSDFSTMSQGPQGPAARLAGVVSQVLRHVRRPGPLVAISLAYLTAVAGIMIWRGISVSPDYLLLVLIPVALLSGRFLGFLRDWVPFVVIFLGWEAMRGIASKTGFAPHVRDLADLKPNVRLCKGIYVEPPAIAFTDYDAVRANYVRSLDALLEAEAYVGVATHDEWLIEEALKRVAGMNPSDYEFQMLLGVREQRADELVAAGHRLRVYVPFGEHWYQYSLRRLQENPAMAGTIAKATVGRLVGRS